MKWICCQLGAREHFAIPRALSRTEVLDRLVTDAWVPPSSFLPKISAGSVVDRFHNELSDAPIIAFNSSVILFEILARARGLGEWETILERNQWFQRKVVAALTSDIGRQMSDSLILLSYSYTALEPFRYAKSRGYKTVLIQIDPGPEEERIVAEEVARVPELAGGWQAAPAKYWACWRQECDLADRIIVNSEWSREGLMRSGIPAEKVIVIPLAHETPKNGNHKSEIRNQKLHRSYPARFTQERPLRVLFLGLINLRKGVARLLEAARILRDEPVEFWMVGPVEIAKASRIGETGRVKWLGQVNRTQVAEFYRSADVFILPTLSDGFAITQLEAQAFGLPIIVSKFCGKVVEDDINGIILDEPSAALITAAVRECIANPERLEKLASASRVHDRFTLQALAAQLQDLGGTM